MRPLSFLVRGESPVVLAREAAWRLHRRLLHARRMAELRRQCPVTFRYIPFFTRGVPEISASATSTIIRAADRILDGVFSVLGYDAAHLGFPPPWNVDFISGNSWDHPAAPYVRDDGADVKVPWELSRLQYAPVLAKAWRLTGHQRYRAAARGLIADWIERNPAGAGVNWAVAMEAALRAMSMCFTVNLLWPMAQAEEAWLQVVTRSLWQHLLFVEGNLEFSHIVRGNHYVSNIVGLFCLSHFLDGRGMARRRRKYQHVLEREFQRQVYADGGDIEASTGYHVLVLQLFTTALLIMRAAGVGLGAEFNCGLRNMFHFLDAVAGCDGRLPQIGDCDDGRVELTTDDLGNLLRPASQRDPLICRNLIGLGAALWGEPTAAPQDDAAWHALPRTACVLPQPEATTVFRDSGLAVVRSADVELWFCNLPNGIAGKGSHTHNDKLAVIVRLWGEELFCDSGTACYTRDPSLRNRFRSAAAHNTAAIDGAEQNEFALSPARLFCLGNQARVTPIEYQQEAGRVVLTSRHYGYQRLGVIHRRTVTLHSSFAELQIEDRFEGTGEHTFELFFHVPEQWAVCEAATANAFLITGPGEARLEFLAQVPLQVRREYVKISRAYGTCLPAVRIIVGGRARFPLTVVTNATWTRVPAAAFAETISIPTLAQTQ